MGQRDAARRLYDVAELQHGFFTARQARRAGYADNTHPYHLRAGNWIREHRAVYRLARFPVGARPDLMLWQLWSHNRRGVPQGTYSHGTALTLHDLTDAMPARLDMTVPKGFQRMAAIPAALRLHRAELRADQVETIDGVRVTRPIRTILDVVSEDVLARDLQMQAIDQALRRGLVIRRQLEAARLTRRARQRLDRLLEQVSLANGSAVRDRRRVSARARSAAVRTRASRRG